jgi:hypothetical protein
MNLKLDQMIRSKEGEEYKVIDFEDMEKVKKLFADVK